MRWYTIATKDYRAARRSRLIKVLFGVFFLVIFISAYLFPIGDPDAVTTSAFAVSATTEVTLVLSLAGLLLGYKAIVGERASDQLMLLLSLPHTRRDVIVGKFLGRWSLLAVVVVGSLAVAGAFVVYPFGSLDLGAYLWFGLLTIGIGSVYLGIGMAISAMTRSEQRATAATFLVFFLFVLIWEDLPAILTYVLTESGVHSGELPGWIEFLHGLEPGTVYDRLVNLTIGDATASTWYLNEWTSLIAFLGWLILPLAFGYRQFEVTDL